MLKDSLKHDCYLFKLSDSVNSLILSGCKIELTEDYVDNLLDLRYEDKIQFESSSVKTSTWTMNSIEDIAYYSYPDIAKQKDVADGKVKTYEGYLFCEDKTATTEKEGLDGLEDIAEQQRLKYLESISNPSVDQRTRSQLIELLLPTKTGAELKTALDETTEILDDQRSKYSAGSGIDELDTKSRVDLIKEAKKLDPVKYVDADEDKWTGIDYLESVTDGQRQKMLEGITEEEEVSQKKRQRMISTRSDRQL